MRKRNFLILTISVFLVALTATIFVACQSEVSPKDIGNPINSLGTDIVTENTDTASNIINDEFTDNELPPESFVGTVIEETTSYMIVEPNKDEQEYKISDRIRVDYITDHIDYLYGKGRKVVITYIPTNYSDAVFSIKTDDIRHDGFEEFELSVQYRQDSIPARFAEIQYAGLLTLVANNRDFDEYASDYNLYYYGLHDVYVTVDGDTLPLKEALSYGKVTLDGIIAECNRLNAASGYRIETSYDDGGSSLYDFGDYKIIKYHTLDGNRDVYIGTKDMGINAKNATAVCIGAYLWKDWGLRLEAREVTPKGATIVFKQKGGNVTGELQTGEAFWLEKLSGGKWISCETNPLLDYAFNMVAYILKNNVETELKTEWKWLYNSLPKGKYRIAKEVDDFRGTGDFDEQIFYAYFEITEAEICSYPSCFPSDEGKPLKIFDYESLNINYNTPGVKTYDFINTEAIEIKDLSEAVTLAKKECTIDYDTVSYAIDIGTVGTDVTYTMEELFKKAEMYEINFSKSNTLGGDQTVYINKNGITQLIIYGE